MNVKLAIAKMFMMNEAFMFKFVPEDGEPEGDNHKIIPTARILAKFDRDQLIELMRHFLWKRTINWKPFDFSDDSTSLADIFHPVKTPDVGISPTTVTHAGVSKKVVWVMTQADIDEINGVSSDGNHRTSIG